MLDGVFGRIAFFDMAGEQVRGINLVEAWGRDPEYLCGLMDLPGIGLVVIDNDAWIRIGPDGKVLGCHSPPRLANGRLLQDDKVVAGPGGRSWTSYGRAIVELDEQGIVKRTIGNAPNVKHLGRFHGTVDCDGRLLLLDEDSGCLHVYSGDGTRLFVCEPSPQDTMGMFSSISVSGAGEIMVSQNQLGEKWQFVRYSSTGQRLGTVPRLQLVSESRSEDWYYAVVQKQLP